MCPSAASLWRAIRPRRSGGTLTRDHGAGDTLMRLLPGIADGLDELRTERRPAPDA
jgi:hypothetical protein